MSLVSIGDTHVDDSDGLLGPDVRIVVQRNGVDRRDRLSSPLQLESIPHRIRLAQVGIPPPVGGFGLVEDFQLRQPLDIDEPHVGRITRDSQIPLKDSMSGRLHVAQLCEELLSECIGQQKPRRATASVDPEIEWVKSPGWPRQQLSHRVPSQVNLRPLNQFSPNPPSSVIGMHKDRADDPGRAVQLSAVVGGTESGMCESNDSLVFDSEDQSGRIKVRLAIVGIFNASIDLGRAAPRPICPSHQSFQIPGGSKLRKLRYSIKEGLLSLTSWEEVR